MFRLPRKPAHTEAVAAEFAAMWYDQSAPVVDVGKPAAGPVPAGVNLPLSRFDAGVLPNWADKVPIMSCAGGFAAWKASGLPVSG